MDILNTLLVWLHLMGLALGGVAAFGIPVVMRVADATPDARPTLIRVVKGLSTVGRAGLGTLIVTGLLLVWLKYGGFGFNTWFHVKMGLVVLLLAGVIAAGIMLKRAAAGDAGAARLAPRIGGVNTVLLIATVLTAALTFD